MIRQIYAGHPHHVTQRGSRRQQVFFGDADYAAYLEILDDELRPRSVELWAYCLMPNHVHLILRPQDEAGLSAALRDAHGRYARRVNREHGWSGHVWQARFFSCAMDERHTLAATRYVVQNPVRAQIVAAPEAWAFSSARDLLGIATDPVITRDPLAGLLSNWREFVHQVPSARELGAIRHHVRRGTPLGRVAGAPAETECANGGLATSEVEAA